MGDCKSSVTSRRSSSVKSGVIQPGAMVSAFYGPFSTKMESKKRRSCSRICGVVLSSHSERNWLVHWFLVGKNAHAPFNKLKVEDDADPVAKKLVEKLVQENKDNYIGGPDQLRSYVDVYVKGGSVAAGADTSNKDDGSFHVETSESGSLAK